MKPAKSNEEMTSYFREALERFVRKLEQDEQVLAAILLGSLSYDQVWEKSDIDLKIIVHDQKLATGYTCFVEMEVPINVSIQTRNDFKRSMERTIGGSFGQSILARSTLLFVKDRTIADYFEQIRHVGDRDRNLRLMQLGSYALGLIAKAEKWLYVKGDPVYSAFWIIKMADVLSQIEVLQHNEVPMRESVQQALRLNPDLFQAVYTEMVGGPLSEEKAHETIGRINAYFNERAERLFQPLLSYMKQEGDVRTVTDIVVKFGALIEINAGSMAMVCDWLAEKKLLSKLDAQTKATPKSRVMLQEPAYLYESDDWMSGESGGFA
ncbi:nucleotidyltransferase domain-containing protein [Paenibacillus soyae]|uniref:Nucleotidyltransferase domain-containing protein n=1 Tax=Paenibacillus soyae TaxID=2969249 RepID=A0A9X2SBV1_9BACL|nr:nucleotidyltransferase domain-containing protein [Paenibacillus soyae]MCR2808039.1 nucleotidyltransferase domain-containing protein [Paenibacillus soyae]